MSSAAVTVKPPLPKAPAGFVPAVPVRHAMSGTNEIGQPFQNIDAHRALATNAVADGAIERFRHILVDRHRRTAARRQPLQFVEPAQFRGRRTSTPESLRRERSWRGLQQRRNVQMIGAEAHPVIAQARRARADRAT